MTASSYDPAKLAFDLIDEFDRLKSADDVLLRMSAALSVFGYTAFLIVNTPEVANGIDSKPLFLLNGWPPGWTDHYGRANYYKDDPMAWHSRRSVNPFDWDEVRFDAENWPRATEVMQVAADFGLKKGFVIPVVRGDGSMAAVTMSGERPDFDPRAKRAIHLIGLYAHAKATKLAQGERTQPERKRLTEGEREVLRWTAAGKTSWEMAHILGIAEVTVVYRLQRATAKLNAVNRTHAVVQAIRAKEISV